MNQKKIPIPKNPKKRTKDISAITNVCSKCKKNEQVPSPSQTSAKNVPIAVNTISPNNNFILKKKMEKLKIRHQKKSQKRFMC